MLLAQLAGLLFIYCLPGTVAPQTNDPIVLNVTVTTEQRAAIRDLARENFAVNIDKRPQEILSFSGDAPSSVGILIDTSGSLHTSDNKTTAQLKQQLKTGLDRLVQLGRPGNEFFVMTFANELRLVQDWTSETAAVTDKLDSIEFKGQTALYDSMIQAVAKLKGARHARRVLILVSDGNDSYSRNEYKDVRETLKRSDVLLYTVGVVDTPLQKVGAFQRNMVRPSDEDLIEFVSYSGGLAFFSTHFAKSKDFTEAFETIAQELRNQYQLTITPEQSDGKQKWRKLNVTVARNDPSGRPEKLIVRTRKGYYR